jgi:hypothetical protein
MPITRSYLDPDEIVAVILGLITGLVVGYIMWQLDLSVRR